VHQPPRQAGANGNGGERIGGGSGLQLCQKTLRAVLGRFLGPIDNLVFGLARVCPQIILEPGEVGGRPQPSQIVGKLRSRLLDAALERIEVWLDSSIGPPRPNVRPRPV
jgi:hypothetical protein